MVINGAHSSITHMIIKSAGKIIYDTDNLHNVTYVKNLLCKLFCCVSSKLYNIQYIEVMTQLYKINLELSENQKRILVVPIK